MAPTAGTGSGCITRSRSRKRVRASTTTKPRRAHSKKKRLVVKPKIQDTPGGDCLSDGTTNSSISTTNYGGSDHFPKIMGRPQQQQQQRHQNDHQDIDFDDDDVPTSGCSTPKAERHRIPEIVTCPPAPKKQRVVSNCSSRLRRTPIAFFASPDIELFFLVALSDISV